MIAPRDGYFMHASGAESRAERKRRKVKQDTCSLLVFDGLHEGTYRNNDPYYRRCTSCTMMEMTARLTRPSEPCQSLTERIRHRYLLDRLNRSEYALHLMRTPDGYPTLHCFFEASKVSPALHWHFRIAPSFQIPKRFRSTY